MDMAKSRSLLVHASFLMVITESCVMRTGIFDIRWYPCDYRMHGIFNIACIPCTWYTDCRTCTNVHSLADSAVLIE